VGGRRETVNGAEVDDSALIQALARLSARIEAAVDRVGMDEASRTATQIRDTVPKRSGRLAATVHPVRINNGGAVSYGGSLPYAAYIEKRTGTVAGAVRTAGPHYVRAMQAAAETETRRI
jgi:hypothetical protein